MKRCPNCKTVKDLDDFPSNRATRDGKATYCKPCHNAITRRNKERRYGSEKAFLLQLRYGVQEHEVEWMLLQQDRLCALCGEKPARHVDHDHVSGRVRGILCFNCNRALGYVDDDWVRLSRAAEYLESHAASGRDG